MKVLIFHGYMLRGTGSNIYNASLAPALARLGHEVHLLCQDRDVRIEGVEVHNPDIGGLLPVYVKDPYEGFEVKAFPELSEEELDRYLDANVAAVRAVAEGAGGIDVALANHLVMGPAILARAGVAPFAAKVHGSALEYTVKPHPRFRPYAEEGMNAAAGVLVGSRHTAESSSGPPCRTFRAWKPRPVSAARRRHADVPAAGGGHRGVRGQLGPQRPPMAVATPPSSSSGSSSSRRESICCWPPGRWSARSTPRRG